MSIYYSGNNSTHTIKFRFVFCFHFFLGELRGGSRGGDICAAFCRTSRCSSDRNKGPFGPRGTHVLRYTGVQGSVPRSTLRTAEACNMAGKGLAGDHPGISTGSGHGRVEVCSRQRISPGAEGDGEQEGRRPAGTLWGESFP